MRISSCGGSSGGPILNAKNLRVIGIHLQGSHQDTDKRRGVLIKKAIDEFIEEISRKTNFSYVSPYSYLDTIEIIYNIKDIDQIRIFGCEFAERYKDKLKIVHNDIEIPIKEKLELSERDKQSDELKIKLKGINFVTDMSCMFKNCKNLKKKMNLSRIDTSKVTSMNTMFEECLLLDELLGINRWNVEKVNSIRGMFFNCINLNSLQGLERWNPINIEDCKEMFYGCKSLPNSETSKIEKWENYNETIGKQALKGYTYGKETNKLIHCLLENFIDTLNYWKFDFFNRLVYNIHDQFCKIFDE